MLWLETPSGQQATLVTDIPITLRGALRSASLAEMMLDDQHRVSFAPDARSSKLVALRDILYDERFVGRQVGIYTHSKKFAKVIVARMQAAGYNAVEWSGDITSARRKEIKAAFLAGEIQYLVSVIRSFSTGLDGFQRVCNRVVWVSEDDNNMQNEQAIRRYFRSGDDAMLADFIHVKIVAKNTWDQGVIDKNVANTLAMRATLSGGQK